MSRHATPGSRMISHRARAVARLAALALVAALVAACGGESAVPDDGGDVTSDALDDALEETLELPDTALPDTALPDTQAPDLGPPAPVPAWLEISVVPPRAFYRLTTLIRPVATVYGLDSQPIPDAEVDWTVAPEGAAEQTETGAWRARQEGALIFTGCTTEPGHDGAPVCAQRTLWVDSSPPTLEVTSPLPGEMLDAATSPLIMVTGRATDTHGNLTVFVNGMAVPLDAEGNFTLPLSPSFGVNHIEVSATDGFHGGRTDAILDVIWARDYLPHDPSAPLAGVAFDDGLELELGQRFFDDDMPLVETANGIQTSDLADILGLLMTAIDLRAQLPDPVIDQAGLRLSLTHVTLGSPIVDIDLISGGAEVFIQVPELTLGTTGSVNANNQVISLEGEIHAGVSLLATLTIRRDSPAEPFVVEISDLTLALEQASSQFVSADANAIFALAESRLRSTVETLLLGVVESSFITAIPRVLLDVLEGLDTALSGVSVPLDTGLGAPITLAFDARVHDLATRPRGALTANLSTVATTDRAPLFPESRGIPLLAEYSESAPFFEHGRLQLGARMALLNGILTALWQSGLLEANLDNFLSPGSTLSARMPPVIHPPYHGEPWDLLVTLGQLEVTLDLGTLGRARYALTIVAGIEVDLIDNVLSLRFAETPDVRAWLLTSEDDDAPLISPADLESMVLTEVWPQISAAFSGGLSFALPIPSLDGLADVAPSLTNLTLGLQLVRPETVRDDFAIFDAMLRGNLPSATP